MFHMLRIKKIEKIVRMVIDNKPKWNPVRTEDVTELQVLALFRSLGNTVDLPMSTLQYLHKVKSILKMLSIFIFRNVKLKSKL